MSCVERKVRLSGEVVSFECELLALDAHHAVLKYVLQEGRNVDMVYLPPQTVTLALYYPDRSYNLYFWASPLKSTQKRPQLKPSEGLPPAHSSGRGPAGANAREIAWYFNLAEPLNMSRAEVSYRDLVVDILVLPDGTAKVLDEAELPAELDPGLAEKIAATKVDLLDRRMSIIGEARELLLPYLLA